MAQAIDSLFVTLGLDITEFERDFAAADKKFQSAANKLQSNARMAKLKMEVDMAGFDAADKSVEALNARMIGLNRVYNEQYKLVQLSRTAWQQTVTKYGEASYQSQKLEARYLREQKALRDLEIQMKRTAAARVETKDGIINELLSFAGVGTVAATAAAVAAALAVVGKASIKLAVDAVESENLFETALGSSAAKARQWSNTISKSLGLNDVEVRKNLGTFFVMLNSMGLTRDKAVEMSEAMTQLAYDMASFYNLPVDQAFEKIKSGITGEMEPLKALGILVDEATVKTYAYSTGIAKQGEELTQQQKVLARFAAIMAQTADAQGDLARTADSPANMLRRIQAEVTKLETAIGNKLLPTYKKLLEVILESFDDRNPNDSYLVNFVGKLISQLPIVSQLIDELSGKKLKMDYSAVSEMNFALDTYMSKAERARQLAEELNEETGKKAYSDSEIRQKISFEYNQTEVERYNKKVESESKRTAEAQARQEQEKNAKILADKIKLTDEINAINQSAFAVEMMQVMRKVEEYRKAGLAEVDIIKFVTEKETEGRRVQLETQRRMMTEIYGTELDKRLLQIDEAKQSYIKAGFDEAKAREMVENQKLKTIKDYSKQAGDAIRSALMGGGGDVVNAIKDALAAGKDGYAAMEKALAVNEKNLRNERQALEIYANRMGLTQRELQLIMPQTPQQQLYQARVDTYGQQYADSVKILVQRLEVVGNSITSKLVEVPYNQQQQPRNVNLNVTVDVQGASMDDKEAADRIAAIITPKVEQAIAGNNYGY